jgi:ribosomal-protein-alanine N-acetyltransferase
MEGWPVTLHGRAPRGEEVVLRPLRWQDRREWCALRADNHPWLARWEATPPDGAVRPVRFGQVLRHQRAEARAGRMLPLVIEAGGRLVGQMHLFAMVGGSLRSAAAGYWVARPAAGRGLAPTALAMACDHAMRGLGLHRVEVNIRPENAASLAVVRKLGFRDEGVRERYLHIDGAWRDHRTFALTVEDLGGATVLARFLTGNIGHIGDTPPHLPGGPR